MNIQLPEDFTERMRQQLGNELPAFLHALDETPVRGIRLNPLKRAEAADIIAGNDRIPWAGEGFYLAPDSAAGSTVLHEEGAFYIQEPGAMIPAAALDAKPGEMILDLCAAPGGKSTQIGCSMQGKGLLVCNEPVPKRAQILSRNIERIGLPNTIVTCAMPEQLAKQWPEGFDAVMVDAPCSGEGMFRREPETRNEWTSEKAAGCAERQRGILSAAAELVRPGGRLVYSTCTYNPEENEQNVRWFLHTFPEFRSEAFALPGLNAPEGMFTCYPHRQRGEGQFAALFRKAGEGNAALPADHSMPSAPKAESAIFRNAFPDLPQPTHLFGSTLVSLPFMPDIKGIRILRAGLHLGETRGKIAIPDHAAALCFRTSGINAFDMSPEQAKQYMAGETIGADTEGWVLMRCQGLTAGWGKGSHGMIKNHYPKGLRGIRYII